MAKKYAWVGKTLMVLGSIGAITWGTVALLNFNVVDSLLGAGTTFGKLVYLLVGTGGVMGLIEAFK